MIEAGMAVIPSRFNNLYKSIPVILPQVDSLNVHINGYTGKTPEVLTDKKITVTVSEKNKNAFMKMSAMPSSEADYFFTMDDDILYPPDYVMKMTGEVDKHGGYSVMCVHGSRFNTDRIRGFINRRKMYSFWDKQGETVQVMMPGNGTCCYPRRAFLDKEVYEEGIQTYSDIDDIYMMCWLHKQGFSVYTVKRPQSWLKPLPSCGSSLQHKRPVQKINSLVEKHKDSLRELWKHINVSN